ncbi:hypothetical protein [Pseudomonas fluorescens]|uniref:Uncharacterized protein n=1 Tax=Pseudomonas fluorescens TaxID=294 RepID=A0A0F4T3C5_PSEFL|nr:hypothetical protein [Pseudomonas fluorescens]KJZ38956.1 hypothetical protein VC34_22840 [Pseudomonas fluorescens]
MQEQNNMTEKERLDEAASHFVAAAFVIGHPTMTDETELKRAAEWQNFARDFLVSKGYEPNKFDFKEHPVNTPDFLKQLNGKDARIPNFGEDIYWIVRAGRISEVLARHYPKFFACNR